MLSTVFFAIHISGVISKTLPCLYWTIKFFARSRPAADVKSVLHTARQRCPCNPYAMQQRSMRKAILTHAESPSNHLFLYSVSRRRKAHGVSPRV